MIFRQVIHDDLGCASYFVGDERAGVAAVVDPKLDIDEYLALARYMDVQVEHILETHNHADHVSGHGRLAAATGATIHIHRLAQPAYDHEPFDDGWELELGSVRIRALHTPGHRPEHTAFALIDSSRGPEPWAVLTGDSLFVGDIARPDLAVDKEEGAHGLFHALNEKLLALPEACEVWPGHLGGSMCGGPGMDMKVSSTIAYERDHNPLLAEDDEDRFVAATTDSLGPQPPNFHAIVDINRGPLWGEHVGLRPLTPRELAEEQAGGALVVDVRTDLEFDRAHIPGALCSPATRAGFGTKLAWIAERDQPLVFVGRDDEDAEHAARLATAIGLTNFAGYLKGGVTSWHADGRPARTVERIDVEGLHGRLDDVQVLDVRERAEWEAGRIPGSANVPYHDLHSIPGALDPTRPVAAICGSGQRSAVGVSLLLRHGFADVIHVTPGGVGTWAARGWPVERAREPAALG